MLTGSASAKSPPFCIGDARAIDVATEIIKPHHSCMPGGVTRRVRFRNSYDIGSSPLGSFVDFPGRKPYYVMPINVICLCQPHLC